MLLPRMIEEKMLVLLRQGKISKWFSGIGQEAIATGATIALKESDYILPLHRNLGVFTNRGVPFDKLFAQWQGKPGGFSSGRERSFHFGTQDYRIVGMISHLAAMLPVANGIGLASNLDGEDVIALAFSGDGGASEGDFHEALNVAAVWDLPVIFLIENNGYGLSTPANEQFRFKQFIDKGPGYGIEAKQVDGNNIIEVYRTIRDAAKKIRKNRKPIIIEAMTFRMRGHEEASGTKYVPQKLFDKWGKKDPILNFEKYLLGEGILDAEKIESIRNKFTEVIELGIAEAESWPDVEPNVEEELADVFVPVEYEDETDDREGERDIRMVDAIQEGLHACMRTDPNLVVMGQDVAEYGGVFKVTQGFLEEFGKDRVRNTPLCESAIIGTGLGLSVRGRASVVEMQFADFVSCGFNQIVNNLAKSFYRWEQPASVTIRMPTGAGVAAGPFHSQSNEAWFAKTAGLKVVYPSNPFDAKGLLISSIRDPNPTLFFEHKYLYRSISGHVPEEDYIIPIGKARIEREGDDVTIVTYGWAVHWALEIAEEIGGNSVEVVDLRSLVPWDKETVFDSVKKTGKCLVLHEDTMQLGFGAEVAACIAENLFEYLDGPIKRVASLDTPVPFNPALEKQFLGKARLADALHELLQY